jgi:hypothetical protein
MHISFKIIKFYFTLCCSTCFGHHCVHHQELRIAAHAFSGHRVVLGRLFPPASSVLFVYETGIRDANIKEVICEVVSVSGNSSLRVLVCWCTRIFLHIKHTITGLYLSITDHIVGVFSFAGDSHRRVLWCEVTSWSL